MECSKLKGILVKGIYSTFTRYIMYPLKLLRDRITGVDFYRKEYENIDDYYYYEGTHLRITAKLKKLCKNVTENDSMLDIGCGKGRMLLFFSRFPFAKVDGVEIDQHLSDIGKRNIRKLRIKAGIYVGDAAGFKRYGDYNYFYLYNPFPEETMRKCVKRIVASTHVKPRKIRVFYANPTWHKVFIEYGFVEEPIELNFFDKIWTPYLSGLKMYYYVPAADS